MKVGNFVNVLTSNFCIEIIVMWAFSAGLELEKIKFSDHSFK